MDYPEQCQVLKTKQRKLWDEGFDTFIQASRCKSELCKGVNTEEQQERTDKMNKVFQEIGNLEIAIQVLREEFYDNQRTN